MIIISMGRALTQWKKACNKRPFRTICILHHTAVHFYFVGELDITLHNMKRLFKWVSSVWNHHTILTHDQLVINDHIHTVTNLTGLQRTGKSCRLRWLNYLRPDVRRGNITLEEQLLILELHSRWGNRYILNFNIILCRYISYLFFFFFCLYVSNFSYISQRYRLSSFFHTNKVEISYIFTKK